MMRTDDDTPIAADELRLVVPAERSELASLRADVRRFVESSGATDGLGDDFALAVSELATNVIEHTDSDQISLTVARHADAWTIDVADAEAVPPMRSVSMPDASEPTGRGLAVVQAIMDSVAVTAVDGTTVIRCTRRVG